MVLAMAVLSESRNKRLFSGICLLSEPVERWHTAASKAIRDGPSTMQWIVDQLSGVACASATAILETLRSADFLAATGFIRSSVREDDSEAANDLLFEDALADRVGVFALALVKCRRRRMLYLMEGYPHR